MLRLWVVKTIVAKTTFFSRVFMVYDDGVGIMLTYLKREEVSMKLSTKSAASLLVVTAVAAAVPGISQITIPKKRRESQFDKLLARHDRKGELRATILGLAPNEFKQISKKMAFEDVIHSCGFYNKRDFRIALLGYLRNELVQRGWSRSRIDAYIMTRAPRMA